MVDQTGMELMEVPTIRIFDCVQTYKKNKEGITDKYILLVCIKTPLTNFIGIKNVTMRSGEGGGGGNYQVSDNW